MIAPVFDEPQVLLVSRASTQLHLKTMPHPWPVEAHPMLGPLQYTKFVRLVYQFKSIDNEAKFLIVLDTDRKEHRLEISNMSNAAIGHIREVIEQGKMENKQIKIIVTQTHWKENRLQQKRLITHGYIRKFVPDLYIPLDIIPVICQHYLGFIRITEKVTYPFAKLIDVPCDHSI